MTTVPVTIQERIPMPAALPRRPAPAQVSQLAVGDIIRILKQRIFLILFIWIVISGMTVAGTWYLNKYHKYYTAQMMLKVDSPTPRTPLTLEERLVQGDLMNRFVAEQAQLVRLDDVLTQTMQDRVIQDTTSWIRSDSKERLFERLKGKLSVAPIPDTGLLIVSFPAADKQDAQKIVETVVAKYLAKVESTLRGDYSSELAQARQTRTAMQGRIDELSQERMNAIGNLGVPGAADGINVPADKWRALSHEAARLEAEKLQYDAMSQQMNAIADDNWSLGPTYQQLIQQDPQIQVLTNTLLNLEQERDANLLRVGPRNRYIVQLEGQIQVTRSRLDAIVREKEHEIREFRRTEAANARDNASAALDRLRERELEFEAKQADLDTKLAQMKTIEEKRELAVEQLKRLDDYIDQLQMLMESGQAARIRKLSNNAIVGNRPTFPRMELFIPAGSFLGLLLGVGLALVLELADTTLKTSRDLVRHVHTPILGTVPDLDDEEVVIDRIELASHTHPRSMVAEAFRGIRTNLLLSSPAERQRAVLVTSARADEGKTTVAVNLAIAIGQSGRRVLLVDANFHRPVLHTLFSNARREGLSNILVGRGSLEDLTSPTDLPNLDVLSCGPIPPNPTELLSGRYLAELIKEAAGRYDQIIFDGPPVLLVTDALVLAGAVDGVILVCRAKSTSRGVAQRAREQLERLNARLFGAVLNAARISRGGYFREQIRSYYDYQPEEALLTASTKALPANDGDRPA